MAYQTVDAVRAMEESSGVKLEELRADGGATVNAWMLQFQADLLGIPVVVPEISETTALGAAYLAGVATGAWSEADVRAMWSEAARYEPAMAEDHREELMDGWRKAIETTRNHSG
jgi:glycerol kinase